METGGVEARADEEAETAGTDGICFHVWKKANQSVEEVPFAK